MKSWAHAGIRRHSHAEVGRGAVAPVVSEGGVQARAADEPGRVQVRACGPIASEAALPRLVDQRADDDHVIHVVRDLPYRVFETLGRLARSRRLCGNGSLR
jgi:hypothetical protein